LEMHTNDFVLFKIVSSAAQRNTVLNKGFLYMISL
jgi:hypothetical protein